jgi:hypothetical protein
MLATMVLLLHNLVVLLFLLDTSMLHFLHTEHLLPHPLQPLPGQTALSTMDL